MAFFPQKWRLLLWQISGQKDSIDSTELMLFLLHIQSSFTAEFAHPILKSELFILVRWNIVNADIKKYQAFIKHAI